MIPPPCLPLPPTIVPPYIHVLCTLPSAIIPTVSCHPSPWYRLSCFFILVHFILVLLALGIAHPLFSIVIPVFVFSLTSISSTPILVPHPLPFLPFCPHMASTFPSVPFSTFISVLVLLSFSLQPYISIHFLISLPFLSMFPASFLTRLAP